MNILERTPYEIWQEIFFHIKDRWVYLEQLSTISAPSPTRRFDLISTEFVNPQNRTLLQLSLVCKALRAMAEKVAYTEIAISRPIYNKFIKCASKRRSQQNRLGEWTKSILLEHSDDLPFDNFLGRLTEVCPNTIFISFTDNSSSTIRLVVWSQDWCQNLRVLHHSGGELNGSSLRYIASSCPNLTQLGIFTHKQPIESPESELSGPIIFPSVQRLGLFSSDYYLTKFEFPSLKHLELGDTHGDMRMLSSRLQVYQILQREGMKLTTLDLNCVDMEQCELQDLRIFERCRNLQTFICRADAILLNEASDYHSNTEAHSSLIRLVLEYLCIPSWFILSELGMTESGEEIPWDDPNRDFFFIKQQSQFFNADRFPNLKSINLAIWESPYWSEKQHIERLRAYVARYFPFAAIEVSFSD